MNERTMPLIELYFATKIIMNPTLATGGRTHSNSVMKIIDNAIVDVLLDLFSLDHNVKIKNAIACYLDRC